eukprot:GHVS01041203.1.p1 GENE.GHVS01041203.1~~GHVS01041203.1.p1  ORF type:complete len:447 (-),score=48.44 GHVS01041203.1:153-1493(-)
MGWQHKRSNHRGELLELSTVSEFRSLKRKMLFVFAFGGAITTGLMAVANVPTMAYLVGVLYAISRICERCGIIFYDAMLKPIACAHSKNPSCLSAEGVACGYVGLLTYAVLTAATLIPAAMLTFPETQLVYEGLQGWLNFRIPLLICAIWWFAFMLVTVLGVRDYPGKPYPYKIKGACHFVYFAINEGARQQWQAFRALFHMRDLGFYTLAWLFLSDAFSTLETMVAVLASSLWKYDQYVILIGALIVYVAAPIGLVFYRYLVIHKWTTPYRVLVFNTITILVTSVGLLWGQYLAVLYSVLLVMGFQLGALDAFGRSLGVTMIPLSSQAQFLSFINLSSKGTSWIAPLVIGVVDSTLWKGKALEVTIIAIVAEGLIGTVILLFGVRHGRGVNYASRLDHVRKMSTCESADDVDVVPMEAVIAAAAAKASSSCAGGGGESTAENESE